MTGNKTCNGCAHHSDRDHCCELVGSTRGRDHPACHEWTDGKIKHLTSASDCESMLALNAGVVPRSNQTPLDRR